MGSEMCIRDRVAGLLLVGFMDDRVKSETQRCKRRRRSQSSVLRGHSGETHTTVRFAKIPSIAILWYRYGYPRNEDAKGRKEICPRSLNARPVFQGPSFEPCCTSLPSEGFWPIRHGGSKSNASTTRPTTGTKVRLCGGSFCEHKTNRKNRAWS